MLQSEMASVVSTDASQQKMEDTNQGWKTWFEFERIWNFARKSKKKYDKVWELGQMEVLEFKSQASPP